MKTSVVIPYYNHWKMTKSLIEDLYEFNKGADEIILMDNGSAEKDESDLWKDSRLGFEVVHLPENIGFLRCANMGMKLATGDILILISNDVQIKENAVFKINSILQVNPRTLIGGRLLSGNTGWNTFGDKTFQYLDGWLLACTKEIWQELGGFDERYAPNDYEDIDLSTTAISKGIALVGLDSPAITHIGAATLKYSPEREAITKINREKFREKWTH